MRRLTPAILNKSRHTTRANEQRVTVADDRHPKTVELDNLSEKDARDEGAGIGVAKNNEVGVLQKAVHHR
jgi:hypothetical protein